MNTDLILIESLWADLIRASLLFSVVEINLSRVTAADADILGRVNASTWFGPVYMLQQRWFTNLILF